MSVRKLAAPTPPLPLSQGLDEHGAAAILGLSVHTLRAWRRQGRGPSFEKHGGAVRKNRGQAGRVVYREDALRTYLKQITVGTDEPAMPR